MIDSHRESMGNKGPLALFGHGMTSPHRGALSLFVGSRRLTLRGPLALFDGCCHLTPPGGALAFRRLSPSHPTASDRPPLHLVLYASQSSCNSLIRDPGKHCGVISGDRRRRRRWAASLTAACPYTTPYQLPGFGISGLSSVKCWLKVTGFGASRSHTTVHSGRPPAAAARVLG